MIYSWQIVTPTNLAEQVARPTDYFKFDDVVTLDQNCPDADLLKGPTIFGSTGLFFPSLAARLEYAVKNSQHPLILWGVGANTHDGKKFEWPEWTGEFDLVGLRDWPNPWNYVPCPSCMHESFSVDRPDPIHKLVIYDQVDFPVGVQMEGVPRENNSHPASEMERIIAFLASGETILTSSYHGAYWGFLLNRKVVVWKPFSTKFYGLKPRTVFADENNLELALSIPQDNDGFLDECRELNRQFYYLVKGVLETK